MEDNLKIQKIIRNLSGDKILQIRILISRLEDIALYSVRAYLQKEYISVILVDTEVESFKKLLEDNGWYLLYHENPKLSERYEKYFKLDNVIDIMVDFDPVENGYDLIYLKMSPDETIQYLDVGNGEKNMLLFKEALQKAGRYDLLLKIS